MSDEEIMEAHLQANQELRCMLKQWKVRAEELHEELTNLARWRKHVLDSVKNGHWHKLDGFISEELIEVLSECEPTDRMSLINEDWEA